MNGWGQRFRSVFEAAGRRLRRAAHFLWYRDDDGSPWLRRTATILAVVVFVLPMVPVLLYRVIPPPTTPLILAMRWSGVHVQQRWVPLTAMSDALVKAVIASEDEKFCSHHGFDWEAIQNAMKENAEGARLRGASTISQQTAKNLFLFPARTWLRKGIEAYFTVLLETFWPKWKIMEAYLNVIEFGEGTFGVEAAAEHYFHKPARRITAAEAARLAAVLPDPVHYRVIAPGPYIAGRGPEIEAMMHTVTRDRLDACVTRYR